MRGEEIEHGAQHPRIADAGAQLIGSQAGEREQPFSPVFALQQPAERGERQGLRVGTGFLGARTGGG